jgi:integrase
MRAGGLEFRAAEGDQAEAPVGLYDEAGVTAIPDESQHLAGQIQGAAVDQSHLVRFKTKAGAWREERMREHRVFKVAKALGQDTGLPELPPHPFRHSCGVELLRRTRGNLRAVQEHLRHQDTQTTTIYTRLRQHELEQIVSVFDGNEKGL